MNIICPFCRAELETPPEYNGQKVQCPECGNKFNPSNINASCAIDKVSHIIKQFQSLICVCVLSIAVICVIRSSYNRYENTEKGVLDKRTGVVYFYTGAIFDPIKGERIFRDIEKIDNTLPDINSLYKTDMYFADDNNYYRVPVDDSNIFIAFAQNVKKVKMIEGSERLHLCKFIWDDTYNLSILRDLSKEEVIPVEIDGYKKIFLKESQLKFLDIISDDLKKFGSAEKYGEELKRRYRFR